MHTTQNQKCVTCPSSGNITYERKYIITGKKEPILETPIEIDIGVPEQD